MCCDERDTRTASGGEEEKGVTVQRKEGCLVTRKRIVRAGAPPAAAVLQPPGSGLIPPSRVPAGAEPTEKKAFASHACIGLA